MKQNIRTYYSHSLSHTTNARCNFVVVRHGFSRFFFGGTFANEHRSKSEHFIFVIIYLKHFIIGKCKSNWVNTELNQKKNQEQQRIKITVWIFIWIYLYHLLCIMPSFVVVGNVFRAIFVFSI